MTNTSKDAKQYYTHILIEDIASYNNTNIQATNIWTSSPGLIEFLKNSKNNFSQIDSIEIFTSEKNLNIFNKSLINCRKKLTTILNNYDANFANIYRTEVYSLFLVIGYKSLILSNWLNKISGKVAIVGSSKLKVVDTIDANFGRYDHLYYNIIDKLDIKNYFDVDLIEVPGISNKLFDDYFNKVPLFDRFFNIINRPYSSIFFKLWMKAGFFKIGNKKRGNIKFLELNEGIEETFLPLLNSGWTLGKISFKDTKIKSVDNIKYQKLLTDIVNLWDTTTSKFINRSIQNKTKKLIKDRLLNSLSSIEEYKNKYNSEINNIPKNTLILSNGLYSTKLRLASSILREKNYKVYTTDHGSSAGINEWFDYIPEDMFNYSSMHFAFNSITQEICKKENNIVSNVGTPLVLVKNRFKNLQRLLARIRCKVYSKDPILIYASYLFSNNKPLGMGTGLDNNYNNFRKKIFKSISKFSGKIIIKPYPALRYIDDLYTTKYLPNNHYVIPQGELRQLRWAGDIIVIDNASSTILWAIATEIPLILINSNRNRLTEKAKIELSDAIFLFDENELGWEKQLEKLLNHNIKDIRKLWKKKKNKRLQVSNKYINGDIGMFAKNVSNIINSNDRL